MAVQVPCLESFSAKSGLLVLASDLQWESGTPFRTGAELTRSMSSLVSLAIESLDTDL